MSDYHTHAARAETILAQLQSKVLGITPEIRVEMAQVEAILALAAAVAGRTGPPPQVPPPHPPRQPAPAPFPPPADQQRWGR
ncbi:hypothetical protein AB0O91_16885 [Kitasatospora sp. NPDC089797]|uniref:hypothetical protein n=1 Tax=Kitasatospora sp. NPDC089797 TaxID=3155298 RepID=UPI00343E4240